MTYSRKNRLQIIGLIDAIYELKQMQTLVIVASDILSGDSVFVFTREEQLERGLYLLRLYETELKTILEEIEDIYQELEKAIKPALRE